MGLEVSVEVAELDPACECLDEGVHLTFGLGLGLGFGLALTLT